MAALVGYSCPDETATRILRRLSRVQRSDERLRQITNEQGSTAAKQQREQAQQVLQEAESMQHIRAQRGQETATEKPAAVECLQVGLNGGWVPMALIP